MSKKLKALTLVEVLVVVAVIGILAALISTGVAQAREAAYMVKAKKELRSVHESLEIYKIDNNSYPKDTSRDIPPGLEVYLAPGIWPDAAWPGSVFDWENWKDPIYKSRVYQISIRFCPLGKPKKCKFPKKGWAKKFDISSSVFHCIEGKCRSHIGKPKNHPGYCVNCKDQLFPYGLF